MMVKQRSLYAQLASQYVKDINDGHYPVGSYLPTESEMAKMHEVSRATARSALNQLVLLGLVSRRKGIGTRVDAIRPSSEYSPSATSAEDLVHYNAATVRKVINIETLVADHQLASRLDGKPGQHWALITTLRYESANPEAPICLTKIYIAKEYAAIAEQIHDYPELIINKICSDFGVTIDQITQSIRAVGITANVAKKLNCSMEEYGLEITRHYYDSNKDLPLIAISIHPSSRYTYTSSIKRPLKLNTTNSSSSVPPIS